MDSNKSGKGTKSVHKEKQFVTFRLEGNIFGIDILSVKEVNLDYSITPIFHSPDMVEGYVNLRGDIFLILNLRKLLSLENTRKGNSNLIIFKEKIGDPFGIIVDSIGDVVTVTEEMFQEFEQSEKTKKIINMNQSQIIEGICRVEKELLVVIDPKKIFSSLNLYK